MTDIVRSGAAAASTTALLGADKSGQQRGSRGGADFSSYLDPVTEGEAPVSPANAGEMSFAAVKFSGSLADAVIDGARQASTGKDVRSAEDASRAIEAELAELASGNAVGRGDVEAIATTAEDPAEPAPADEKTTDIPGIAPAAGQSFPMLLQFERGVIAEGLQATATDGESAANLSTKEAVSSGGQTLAAVVLKSETHFLPQTESVGRFSEVLNGSTLSQKTQGSLSSTASTVPLTGSALLVAASETAGRQRSASAALASDLASTTGSDIASRAPAATVSDSAEDTFSPNTGKRPFSQSAAAASSTSAAAGGAAAAVTQDASPSEVVLSASASTASGAVAQQVANAISAASSADTSQPTSRVALPAAETTQPVRTLTLGLTPQNLGEVTVRLSMNGSKLSVVLSVEQPEAAQLLAQDRETLEGLLRSTGYKVDTVSIQLAPQPVTPVTTGSVTASGDQAQSGSADTGSDGMGRSGQKDRGESGNRSMKEGSEHGQAESHRNRGALYI
ncbi:hypothetical protein T281_07240 [Rhodomicrobium udaipurense JA643]|uniref:Flagellar hook-length control protein FliK n=1 Tax=Rhodomicrobium udaipurense TaxID=1202716 RepID=A0A8I1GCK5_9HYPH|nr:flagellar hook-length control protein FliK [Rhodomicrobium udaipurense]KAI95119.1 hypothetical protein T281_07240 [Rhodomicrobium udaipurense JA643]MBJ7542003.1 flagellar hook-length control protein FliK [Rhodomicrobium udaipurense]